MKENPYPPYTSRVSSVKMAVFKQSVTWSTRNYNDHAAIKLLCLRYKHNQVGGEKSDLGNILRNKFTHT
jgi:hypothetical protein